MTTKSFITCPHCKGCGKIEATVTALAEAAVERLSDKDISYILSSFRTVDFRDFIDNNFPNISYKFWDDMSFDAMKNTFFQSTNLSYRELLKVLVVSNPSMVVNYCIRNGKL